MEWGSFPQAMPNHIEGPGRLVLLGDYWATLDQKSVCWQREANLLQWEYACMDPLR